MSQLKKCPFCGGEGELYEPNEDIAVISCLKCNAESGYYDGEDSTTPDDAIKFWNTRTPHPQQNVHGLITAIDDAIQEIEYDCTNGKMVAADLRKALKSYQEGGS